MFTSIWLTFFVEGLHCYPGAAHDAALEADRYLADMHRHLFGFKIQLGVLHDDRDVEFLSLRRELVASFGPQPVDFGTRSCEAIARELRELIVARYPGRHVAVSVSEDGENGAEVVG